MYASQSLSQISHPGLAAHEEYMFCCKDSAIQVVPALVSLEPQRKHQMLKIYGLIMLPTELDYIFSLDHCSGIVMEVEPRHPY